jgi:hypothetical protein
MTIAAGGTIMKLTYLYPLIGFMVPTLLIMTVAISIIEDLVYLNLSSAPETATLITSFIFRISSDFLPFPEALCAKKTSRDAPVLKRIQER